jgi:hypothetical protein
MIGRHTKCAWSWSDGAHVPERGTPLQAGPSQETSPLLLAIFLTLEQ